ncbi:hypothetical protein DFH11DRAFT_1687438 [Phellopilus nigrolimitatus]|nr:hypothetical protein DFH11DRAFT_1687438 [Phellopilus nigrolimitatus]
MALHLFLIFLVCFVVALLSYAKDIQGDNFCGDLMCVTAFVNDSTVTYQMTALNQLGWMAMGFGTQMTDAKMVIMWPNTDGKPATGLVEPDPDPNPPRLATTYQPLTTLNSVLQRLSFTVPKDDTVTQSAVWALGFANPDTSSPNCNFSTTTSPSSSPSSPQIDGGNGEVALKGFENIIIAHGVLCVAGFLMILPIGALIARWGRTLSENWFHYHWETQVVFSIPVVVVGWALGPLAVAAQGATHADDAHKICGILLFPLYIIQLCLGTFIHFFKPLYPRKHPPQNFVHGGLGIAIIGLAFFEIFSNLWTAWTIVSVKYFSKKGKDHELLCHIQFIPLTYLLGFLLLPRQVAHERELPPPYSPGSEREESPGIGMRHLLGLDHQSIDDGTHDIFSEAVLHTSNSPTGMTSGSVTTTDEVEMREVPAERWTPVTLANS